MLIEMAKAACSHACVCVVPQVDLHMSRSLRNHARHLYTYFTRTVDREREVRRVHANVWGVHVRNFIPARRSPLRSERPSSQEL
jgi:hypothetical protein